VSLIRRCPTMLFWTMSVAACYWFTWRRECDFTKLRSSSSRAASSAGCESYSFHKVFL